MFAGTRSLRSLLALAVTVALVSRTGTATAQAPTFQLQLSPQDTSINIDAISHSAQTLLTAYTWPDNQIANAILLKFDLSALPPGATVNQAVLNLALVESDATADAMYTMTAYKMVGRNPAIAAATGYTADGVTAWTPSACCYNGVPLAQGDLSAPYASLAVDKTLGVKTWAIASMVREWVANPSSNFGLVLNSDATKARDRYRYFASTKYADTTLRPVLQITYSVADTTPPVISAVISSSITGSAATIGWATSEPSDSQVDYGSTTAYGSASGLNASQVTAHSLQLSGLVDAAVFHYRVRSRDASGNLAVSGDFTFKTLDKTAPVVSISSPAAGATVNGTVTVSAQATDNVGVASVQFRLDGVNLGALDTTSPYAASWNTTTATAGSHSLRAVAKDAAGNTTTSTALTVTVSNADTSAPTVAITAPVAGASVSGAAVAISATASDNVAVVGVQFKLDGANLGAEDTASPYTATWNTTTVANGAHTLSAVARDAAANTTTSAAVTVTISNDTTAPVISGVGASAITSAGATIGWATNEGSDSQVDYGVTTAYGSSTTLNTTAVTAHSQALSSLTASTSYHARVRSRDAAGNLAVSGDLAFTTSSTTPPPAGWPHEPAGFAAWASSSLDSFSGNGWDIVNPNGYATVAAGTGGTLTPANVGQWKYPTGFAGGSAPATMYHALPSSFNEGFVGVMWKPSNPWQGHSTNVNKIFFLLGGACGNLIPIMYGPPGGPYQLRVAPEWGNWSWLTPNVNAVPIALGAWHKIELYFKYNTAGSGIVRWWMDGTLIGDYTNVTFPSSGCLAEFQFSPTWGGVGDVKNETDYFWFDDAYISRPGTGTVTPPPSPPAATILFQEGFDDANLAGRGWYDNPNVLLSTTEHIANSTSSIQYTFMQGATSPTAGSALRKTFTPTDSIYLGHWVKYSTNWVGSQKPYHPHQFHFLTTFDGPWSGLSFDYLTAYIEQNGGTPLIAIQDGTNVDQTRVGVDLTGITEKRGVAGCNGSSDGYPDNCYSNGSAFVNEKKWWAPAQYFTDTAGPFYKSDWHFVEAFVKMNSIVGGKGVNDGVVQYWFDGQLIIDHHDVLLRTGANAAMQFNQLVIAPYIGDGSPVTQSLWIDSLTVGTGRP